MVAEMGQSNTAKAPGGRILSDTRTSMDRTPSPTCSSHSEPVPFPGLKATTTSLSLRARQAAEALEAFNESAENPRNWPNSKKWKVTVTVSLTGFLSTCGSSIGVPGIHAVRQEFGVESEKLGILFTSFYVLGLGCGPFLFAPISELYGRQTAYLTSLIPYTLFTLGTALSPNIQTLIILRFICGCFGSSGPALGVATIADVWAPSQRGKPISLYALGPMAGPVLGSMLGYWLLYGGWRWLFWTLTILAAVNLVAFIFLCEETYAPVIEKVLRYRATHPIAEPSSWSERLSPTRAVHSLKWMTIMVSRSDAREVFGRAFSRPPRLLFGNPVAFIFSAYYAYIYAIIYVFLVSVPLLYGSPPFNREGLFSYQWGPATISLSYIGLAIGFFTSATTAAIAQDRIYRYLSKRSGTTGQPEFRLVLTQIGMVIFPTGLLIFGWTAHYQTHWIGPQIGMTLVALGLMLPFNSIQNFLVDAFFPYSAAAIAAASAFRAVLGCILPLFGGDIFYVLGWGWGGTLLAGVSLIAVPAPMIMFKYGKELRERFAFEG